MSAPVMQVRLRADFGKRCVLSDVQFDLGAGEALGMVGSSGAGKTTLVMALLGLLPWRGGKACGEVLIDGCNLLNMPAREARRIRGKKIAMIPQSPMTALNAAVSLRAHFEEAWRAHETSGRRVLESRLRELMREVQLPAGDHDFLRRKPGQISVGQAQRVLGQVAQDVGRVAQLDPVQLQIGPGGEVAVAAIVVAGDPRQRSNTGHGRADERPGPRNPGRDHQAVAAVEPSQRDRSALHLPRPGVYLAVVRPARRAALGRHRRVRASCAG